MYNGLWQCAEEEEDFVDCDNDSFEYLPSRKEAREAVQSWISAKFDEHPDSTWVDHFMFTSVKPTVMTLALSVVAPIFPLMSLGMLSI